MSATVKDGVFSRLPVLRRNNAAASDDAQKVSFVESRPAQKAAGARPEPEAYGRKDEAEHKHIRERETSISGDKDDGVSLASPEDKEKLRKQVMEWYVVRMQAGPKWMTEGIVDEALRLESELTSADRLEISEEYGYKGISAIKTLVASCAKIRGEDEDGNYPVAKPMDKPGVDELIDDIEGQDTNPIAQDDDDGHPVWMTGSVRDVLKQGGMEATSGDKKDEDDDLLGDSFFESDDDKDGPIVIEDDIEDDERDDDRDDGDRGFKLPIHREQEVQDGGRRQTITDENEDDYVRPQEVWTPNDTDGDDRSSTTISNDEMDKAIENLGKKKLASIVGGRNKAEIWLDKQMAELGLSDVATPHQFVPALWHQLEKAVDYQGQVFAWENFGDEPPEGMKSQTEREAHLVKVATSIITLRDQIPDETIEQIVDIKKNTEHAKWLIGRADVVLKSLIRDKSPDIIRALLGGRGPSLSFMKEEDEERAEVPTGTNEEISTAMAVEEKRKLAFVEHEYRDQWKVIDPILAEYKKFASQDNIRVYRTIQIIAESEKGESEYDAMDTIIGDIQKNSSDDESSIVGISFAMIPSGNWTVEMTGDNEPFAERFVLHENAEGSVKGVRLSDRCLRIFDEWCGKLNRNAKCVIHLVLEPGAVVDGKKDAQEIAVAVRSAISRAAGYEVRVEPWSQEEWTQDVLPLIRPAD